MALQYEGQNIGTIRDAVEGDEGYAPGMAAILLSDGTVKVVDRSEIKTEAQQAAEKAELEKLEAETAPDAPPDQPTQYDGQNVETIRDAIAADEGYVAGEDMVVVRLADGSTHIVRRTELVIGPPV